MQEGWWVVGPDPADDDAFHRWLGEARLRLPPSPDPNLDPDPDVTPDTNHDE